MEYVFALAGLAAVHFLAVTSPGPSTVLALGAFNEFTWFAILALVFSGGTARAFYRRTKFWLDRIMGGALALLGLRLALSSR